MSGCHPLLEDKPEKNVSPLIEHIQNLEKRIIELEKSKVNIIGSVASKKPHRCPICDGNGFYYVIITKSDCKACNSKGIVWG